MPLPGQPSDTPIPPHLNRWNWGAFLLNWIWGIGNSTYIALLMFVPFVNIVMIFVLGAKGSRWAWKNRVWADEAHFVRTQRNWAWAGLIIAAVCLVLLPGLFFGANHLMTSNDAYRQSMAALRSDARAIAALGEPIEAGWFVAGKISLKNSSGTAKLAIPVSGPKASGTLFSKATKTASVWTIDVLALKVAGIKRPIVLIGGPDGEAARAARPIRQRHQGAHRRRASLETPLR